MTRKALSLCLTLSLGVGPTTLRAAPAPVSSTDPELAKGIKLAEDGDYDAAILTLDAAARRLASDPSKVRDLSQAYLYLGIAYVGKGHEAAAKAKFREALEQIKDLSLSPDRFPPKVIDLFEAAKQEAAKALPLPSPEAKKGGGHKGLLIAGGVVAVGAAVAVAAGGGGAKAAPAPTPIPLKTDTYGPISLSTAQYCESTPFNVFVTASGTLTATLMWQETFALLQMGLFDNATSFSNGTNILTTSSQTSNTSATLTYPVTAKQYYLGVCHTGDSCANMTNCSATFTLTVQHP